MGEGFPKKHSITCYYLSVLPLDSGLANAYVGMGLGLETVKPRLTPPPAAAKLGEGFPNAYIPQ